MASYRPLIVALPMLGVSYVVFLALAPSLNLLSLGEDLAAARGVNVLRTERVAFLSASLATGAAVSIAGPIGFVGIVRRIRADGRRPGLPARRAGVARVRGGVSDWLRSRGAHRPGAD